jgi:hypothetical protein
MMQRASTQEKTGRLYQTTRRNIPIDSNHCIQGRDKVISETQSTAAS